MHFETFPFVDLLIGRHALSRANLASALADEGDETLIQEIRHQHTSAMPLTPLGLMQSKRKGTFLLKNGLAPLDFYYTSRYLRAIETVQMMGIPNSRWTSDPRLNERDWGPMDQISSRERGERWPTWKAEKEANPHEWKPVEGESIRETRDRALSLLKEASHLFPRKRGMLVAHGETNQYVTS